MGTPSRDTPVRERARADLTWFIRHADVLRRWPVIDEEWARHLEERRLAEAGPAAVRLHGARR